MQVLVNLAKYPKLSEVLKALHADNALNRIVGQGGIHDPASLISTMQTGNTVITPILHIHIASTCSKWIQCREGIGSNA